METDYDGCENSSGVINASKEEKEDLTPSPFICSKMFPRVDFSIPDIFYLFSYAYTTYKNLLQDIYIETQAHNQCLSSERNLTSAMIDETRRVNDSWWRLRRTARIILTITATAP